MASIVVRCIDDRVKQRFRELAAGQGHSMESQLRILINDAVRHRRVPEAASEDPQPWALRLQAVARQLGGVDLEILPRDDDLTEHSRRGADFTDLP